MVCIVGAGASGLAAAKVLYERGVPFDCFEMGSGVGGNWRYGNDNGLSSIYASLTMNTSRTRAGYRDFPMPDDYPDFPDHRQVLAYFESYVDHFGFRDAMTFRTEVTHVAPAGEGAYDVTVQDVATGAAETRRYEAVIVANGHHWDPYRPSFPGTFGGTVLHAHDYDTPGLFEGRRVLIVGVGNSGCDIACEAASVAEATLLSTRRGAHVIPKYLLGRPLDLFVTPLGSRLPRGVQQAMFRVLVRLTRGAQRAYGFPEPAHRLGEAHPTISEHLLGHVRDGRVTVKPNVRRLAGDSVIFEDGTEEIVDVLLYATGYNVRFPFFDEGFLPVEDNRLPLFRHVVPPAIPNLYVIGLIQPLGAIMPLAEAQAEWVADLIEGRAALPSRSRMEAVIRHEEAQMARQYVSSRRHTMEVDFYPYLRAVQHERRSGRTRAAR